MQTFIAAVSSALIISFMCSVFESVVLSINTAQVEALAKTGARSGRLMRQFKERIDVPIAAILIVNTIAHTIGAAVAGASYQNVFDPGTLWIFSIVFTLAVLLFTEIIPKTLGVTHAMALAPVVAYGIQALIVVLRPIVAVTEKISAALRGDAKSPITSIEEIRLLAQLGRSEGAVGARTAGIIVGATQLRELCAVDVMLPRREVVYLSGLESRRTVVDRVRESRHSRFPYTPTDAVDQFSGVVLAKELLLQLDAGDSDEIDWNELVHEPVVVPEYQPLNMLLRTFQEERRHMAFVVDEYGQFLGIVTIEDVLEEIVGDIIDESDMETELFVRHEDGSLEVDADIDLRRVAAILEVDWNPAERSRNVNGLVMDKLGRLPQAGDTIEWQGHVIEVLAASELRAERVSVRKAGK
ncbi:MAG TPA: hemolysin family protein [Gammaproteobacteria bacterium]